MYINEYQKNITMYLNHIHSYARQVMQVFFPCFLIPNDLFFLFDITSLKVSHALAQLRVLYLSLNALTANTTLALIVLDEG